MKIIYAQNPLETVVELDDHDRQVILLKQEIEHLKYAIIGIHLFLRDNRPKFPLSLFSRKRKPDLKRARKEADCLEDMDAWKEKIYAYCADFEDVLKESHCGDCTCVACSCEKCHVEWLLGINTTPGLGQHEASHIDGVFRLPEITTCQQAIEWFEANPVTATEDWHHYHIERWNEEQKNATEWLKTYKNTHLS